MPNARSLAPWMGLGLLLAAAPPGTATVPPAGSSALESHAVAELTRRPTLVESRDLVSRARGAHGDGEHARALTLLDEAIAGFERILTESPDRTVRRAAGDLMRSAAGLRLAVTRELDHRHREILLIGPPRPDDAPREGEPSAPPDHHTVGVWLPGPPAPDGPTLDDGRPVLPGVELVTNPRVERWIDYYRGRGRTHFERYYARSGLYREWMADLLESEGLPAEIVHLVFVESGFNNHAVSRSYAVGQWQFIRSTAQLFGLRMNAWVDERRDPEMATIAAARYLRHLHALFGEWPLALAAYNCGEGGVIRAIARQGTKDYWRLRLPRETRDYVPKFMAVLAIGRDPRAFGFESLESQEPLRFDTVRLPGPVDLAAVARACEAEVDELRFLNPALLKNAALPRESGVVAVRVPHGKGDGLVAALAAGEVELPRLVIGRGPSGKSHKVRRGETLIGLARKYRVPVKELARANGLSTRSKLRRGQWLNVPGRDEIQVATITPAAKQAASSTARKRAGLYEGTKTIRIRRGDTLSGIAKRHGTDVRTLRALNNLRPRQAIRAGGKLKVPVLGG